MESLLAIVFVLLAIVVGAALYFLPLMIAGMKHHPRLAGIGVLNFFLGWTVAGWVVALIWAVSPPPDPPPAAVQIAQVQIRCQTCGVLTAEGARFCASCGREL